MARPLFTLDLIEKTAQGKGVSSIRVHYQGRLEPVTYAWANRKQIRWENVRRCRLNFSDYRYHIIDGEAAARPGFRVKPKG